MFIFICGNMQLRVLMFSLLFNLFLPCIFVVKGKQIPSGRIMEKETKCRVLKASPFALSELQT